MTIDLTGFIKVNKDLLEEEKLFTPVELSKVVEKFFTIEQANLIKQKFDKKYQVNSSFYLEHIREGNRKDCYNVYIKLNEETE